MLEMSCEEHDKLAARSQFLTHTIARYYNAFPIYVPKEQIQSWDFGDWQDLVRNGD